MGTAIKVENLSKAYQLGQFGTKTISGDVQRWWMTKVLGKEDPYLKIGESNDRSIKGESNIVWSLKDINFEVKQGEALGIIGKNGAGKSTLLKILSRVTSPTKGGFKLKGRVASLLEVGTGFHPELTGKENIFLNGAILGMRKHEIQKRLDEIIDFAGIERYVDTPVKRYSSGMYVRLAFAVAAHLDAEILVVDEVLAVGDAEFQKKCLGKMGDISKGEGRTILFVSHNMGAIQSLCEKAIVLDKGCNSTKKTSKEAVDLYLNKYSNQNKIESEYINKIEIKDVFENLTNVIMTSKEYFFDIYISNKIDIQLMDVGFFIIDETGNKVGAVSTSFKKRDYKAPYNINEVRIRFVIKNLVLMDGDYYINVSLVKKVGGTVDFIENIKKIQVVSDDFFGSGKKLNSYYGKVYIDFDWYV